MTRDEKLLDLARRINALTMNPHWTSDRRWKIEELSRQMIQLLERAL